LTPGVGHTGALRAQASYVADWIGAQTLGEPAPAACTPGPNGELTDEAAAPVSCATPPPNN
jgi:hypothetical protein